MLPLWPKRLLISLSATQVALMVRQPLTKRILVQRHLACTGESHDWISALNTLTSLLADLQLPANTPVNITIASDFVRYLTLPPQQKWMSASERHAFASAAYREIYGAIAQDWLIKCSDAAPAQTLVASAIDQAFFDAIQQLMLQYQLRLHSVAPYLMTVYNRMRAELGQTSAILAMVEPNRLLLLNLKQGDCQEIRAYTSGENWQAELNQLLAREQMLSGEDMQNILVYAPAHKSSSLKLTPAANAENRPFKRITLASQINNTVEHYAMLEAMA